MVVQVLGAASVTLSSGHAISWTGYTYRSYVRTCERLQINLAMYTPVTPGHVVARGPDGLPVASHGFVVELQYVVSHMLGFIYGLASISSLLSLSSTLRLTLAVPKLLETTVR